MFIRPRPLLPFGKAVPIAQAATLERDAPIGYDLAAEYAVLFRPTLATLAKNRSPRFQL
jgi:hypothetical protein